MYLYSYRRVQSVFTKKTKGVCVVTISNGCRFDISFYYSSNGCNEQMVCILNQRNGLFHNQCNTAFAYENRKNTIYISCYNNTEEKIGTISNNRRISQTSGDRARSGEEKLSHFQFLLTTKF